MNRNNKLKPRPTRLGHYTLALVVFWTFAIAGFTFWRIHHIGKKTHELAIKEARTIFNKDQSFRFWATNHGGVYVPTNERTPPNPNLAHIPERDITTPSGKKLTLMNPAYIIRQVHEEFASLYKVGGHITSLKPLRQKNAPDAWERKTLQAFERGVKEVSEFSDINGELYLRLMLPMRAKKGCLKCHGIQGYKEGDVRGGISVSVPMTPYLAQEYRNIIQTALPHIIIWIIGLCFIGIGYRGIRIRINERELAEDELFKNQYFLQKAQEIGHIGTWELDIKKNELFWTDENYRIFGLPIGTELTYETFLNCVHPDDREYVDTEWKAAFNKKPYDIEHRLLVDGKVKWVREKAELEFNKKDECIRGTGFTQDITERKQMQDELVKHRDHLEDKVRKRTDELTKVNQQLNQEIEERKKAGDELKKRTDELQTMINAMSGRELRMAELKKVIETLRAQIESEGLTPVADDPLKEVGKEST